MQKDKQITITEVNEEYQQSENEEQSLESIEKSTDLKRKQSNNKLNGDLKYEGISSRWDKSELECFSSTDQNEKGSPSLKSK
mmetsp:Transcript_8650/g.7959  ORF Transcript_8650/g.7959 Transcript_8650/m.7959 type:complete len:82 (+) Transcript_8650:599-844(+)